MDTMQTVLSQDTVIGASSAVSTSPDIDSQCPTVRATAAALCVRACGHACTFECMRMHIQMCVDECLCSLSSLQQKKKQAKRGRVSLQADFECFSRYQFLFGCCALCFMLSRSNE